MKLAVEVGKIGRPKLFGFWALLLDPFGKRVEDLAALLPFMQIFGAANGDFPFTLRTGASAEEVPSVAVFDDGRVVDEFRVAFDRNYLGSCDHSSHRRKKENHGKFEVSHGHHLRTSTRR